MTSGTDQNALVKGMTLAFEGRDGPEHPTRLLASDHHPLTVIEWRWDAERHILVAIVAVIPSATNAEPIMSRISIRVAWDDNERPSRKKVHRSINEFHKDRAMNQMRSAIFLLRAPV